MVIDTKFKKLNIHGFMFKVNKDLGYAPYFMWTLLRRINKKMSVVVAVTGEAGIGKSYMACQIARILDKKFTIDQVVFTYQEYLEQSMNLGPKRAIVFDEPSYAMGKREWYKQINQALVKMIESQRFLLHPLIIPIININLLDKSIRGYLIQYHVHLHDRGKANVYSIQPSPFQDKVYRRNMCELRYALFDQRKCDKDSCLTCKELDTCQVFRAQYERKKRSIQFERYEQDKERAIEMDTKQLTNTQLVNMIYQYKDEIINDRGLVEAQLMRGVLEFRFGIVVGLNKGNYLRKLLLMQYPELNK